MFYSQTFLARKGPMGTVWCAAHLQHRLKKSHYTSTNIIATVDLIMYPEVPLALRMSGHLLLGVVRIYSKKVDYLVQDCNVVLTSLAKAFDSIKVNLPEDARQAPVESVTLPETLNLDDFNFDDDTLERDLDNHLRSQEEITLTDQIPTDTDPYVAITFDEDVFSDSRPMDVDSHSTMPVDADINKVVEEPNLAQPVQDAEPNNRPGMPDFAVDTQVSAPDNQTEELSLNVEFQDSRPDNLTDIFNTGHTDAVSPQNSPEIEKMRDAVHDLSPGNHPPFGLDLPDAIVELTECLDQSLNAKENQPPTIDEQMLSSGGHSPLQQHVESPAFAVSEGPENFGHSSPQLALRSTPPPVQQQPEPRPRKRKLFDKATVLTNKFMKQRLEDASDLLRRRRSTSSFPLGIWKSNNRSRKEQVFNEPLLTGFSDELHNVFNKEYITSKSHLTVVEEAVPESTEVPLPACETETDAIPELTAVQSPNAATEPNQDDRVLQSPTQETEAIPEFTVPQSPHPASEPTVARSSHSYGNDDMEIECLRDGGLHELMHSPNWFSLAGTDQFTPQVGTSTTSTTAPGFTAETAPGFTAETAPYETEPETRRTIPEDLFGLGNSGLSNIPEMDEELSFLEVANNDTPSGSQSSQGVDALSVRTRALARYLTGCSSISPTSEGPSEELSLNKILEGKTRKLSARMFFETLVLKTSRLIDVQQDQPYGDITLKLTPMLFSKAQL